MFNNEFYGVDSEAQGDSLFGDIASADPSMEGLHLAESSPQAASETEYLWTSGSGNYDIFPSDSSQDPIISEDSDLLISSCGGTDVQKRYQLRTRNGEACASPEAPLKFKIPTIPPLLQPKKPAQTEIVPTLGRLRFGSSSGMEDPICSVEPYDHHLCCDGPIGDEAMDFGDLKVYTPVKNCLPGKFETRHYDGCIDDICNSLLMAEDGIGTGIFPCSTPPPFDICCQTFTVSKVGSAEYLPSLLKKGVKLIVK